MVQKWQRRGSLLGELGVLQRGFFNPQPATVNPRNLIRAPEQNEPEAPAIRGTSNARAGQSEAAYCVCREARTMSHALLVCCELVR